jgi:hypothetical protein
MTGMKLQAYALFCALSAVALFGQGTTSRLTGTVLDPSGSPIAGATVRLTNEGTNQSFTVPTGDNGVYTFDALQSGAYSVAVEVSGFKKFISKNNAVTIGQPTTVNVRLEVGAVTESVEVAASYEQVQTSTSGNIGNIFSEKIIKDLPIVGTRGRNPLDLVTRQPGVVSGANTGGGVHVNGARDRAWNFTIDGIDANETSAGGSNFAPIRTNPDSLAEFRVLTGNATAEFGRNSGGQVAMITRSGTNEFHGSGFWFYRTPRLNANEWDFNLDNLVKRQFVQNIYGGSIGGRIIRNRTFFFANVQRLTARESAILDRTVYTQSARQGIWRYNRGGRNLPAGVAGASVDAQGNVVPGASIGQYNVFTSDPQRVGQSARIRDIVGRTPLPNRFDGGDGLNTAIFRFAALQNEKQYDTTFKVDHIINDKNTVFARISLGEQNTNCDRVNGGAPFFPDGGCVVNTLRNPQNLAFNWRTNPTSRLTNEFVFGRNFFAFDFVIPTSDLNGTTLTGAPITVPETFDFGNKRELNTWQIVNNTSYFLGAHTFRWGTNIRLASHTDVRGSIGGSNSTTQVNFNRLVNTVDAATFGLPADINQQFDRNPLESNINFLLGRVGDISRGFVAEGDRFVPGVYNFKALFNEYDLYVQDTWKLSKRLTIDLGLRWEAKMAPTSDPGGRLRRPTQGFTVGAASTTALRWEEGSLYRNDLNNFAPSVGFAWDPFGDGKTAIRSNYRLAFDRINTFSLSSSVFQNLPGIVQGRATQELGQAGGRLTQVRPLDPPSTNPNSFAQPPAFSLNNITVVDPDFQTPQTHQWSFGIQRQIARATVLELNYIGRRAHNLFGGYNSNQVLSTQRGLIDAVRSVNAGGESAIINQLMMPDIRRQPTETGSQAVRRLYAADLRNNAAGTILNDIGRRTVAGGRSQVDAAGLPSGFLFPFPQFAGALNVIDSNDFSTYHALQVQLDRRFTNGFTYQVAYTWAKSLDTRSFDPAFTITANGSGQAASSTPFDIYNRRYNYAPSDFDRRHVLQSYWVWELPFGKGKRFGNTAGAWSNRLIGGWQLAGFLTVQGGRPFTIFSGINTVYNTVNSTADCASCRRDFGALRQEGGLVWYLSPEERAAFAATTEFGSVGSTGRNFFRGPRAFNMDMSASKRVAINERMNLELRADMTNFTNTPTFGFPTALVNSTTFGRIRNSVISGSRKIQLGAKFNF